MLAFTSSKPWILATLLSALACGEEAPPSDPSGIGGAAGSASGSAGGSGAPPGGSAGTAGSMTAAGTSGAFGNSGSAGTSGTAGTAAGGTTGGESGRAGSGGVSAAGGAGGASTAGGASGFGGASGASGAPMGGASGAGQAGFSSGGASAGSGGSGGAGDGGAAGNGNETLCLDREGGAMIDVDVLGEKLRFWTTNAAFIDEVEQSLGEIPERIPLLALADGTDCDASWTFHIDPSNPRFEDDWIDICDVELSRIEDDKAFYLANGDFCPRFMRIERVETR
jgi:hypothetical protein